MSSKVRKPRSVSLTAQKSRAGVVFILPWLVGFVFFFAIPLVQSLVYTFNTIDLSTEGMTLTWAGFDNYVYAFTGDPDFTRNIVTSTLNILYQVPIIVAFSLFIAIILKADFRGKTLMRAIFFLPVIISSGVVITILRENVLVTGSGAAGALFQTGSITEILVRSGLSESFVKMITQTVSQVFDLTWRSGVQILLLLSALHSIPESMYEAAKIEGATAWEIFWKITFVMISPTIILALVYSIIDYFTDYSNQVMRMIVTNVNLGKFEYSTTISILYFAVVMIIISLVYAVLSKRAFYQVN
jgi:ABC-type sugar transport system permease subunit